MIEYCKTWLELHSDKRAVTAIEYGLIAALMAAVIVLVMATVGNGLQNAFNSIAGHLNSP